MKKIYEVKAFYERTTYEQVAMEVEAESKEEAFHLIQESEGEWINSKDIDSLGGEWKHPDEWEVTGTRMLPGHDLGGDSEEYN